MQLERNGKRITDITFLKKSVIIKIDDETIRISKDSYLQLNLYIGKPITDIEIDSIKEIDSISKAMNYILKFLAKKRYSKKEIKNKLHAKNLKSSQISHILEILESKNLINDFQLTKDLIIQLNEKCYGKFKIIKTLKSKGLSVYDNAFNDLLEKEKATKQACKIVRRNSDASYTNLLNKITQHLMSLGFEKCIIDEVIDELPKKNSSNELNNLRKDLKKAVLRNKNKLSAQLLKEKCFALLTSKGYELEDIITIWEENTYEDDS